MTEKTFKYFTLHASIVLLVLSTVYYMQRVIMYDTSFYLFELLDNNTFCIQHNRYTAFVTQLLPLFFIWLKLPLKLVAIAYSINITLLFILLSSLAGICLKKWNVAAAIILCPFLINTQEFFWMVSESQFTPAIWLFIFAFIQHRAGKSITISSILILMVLLFFGLVIHPLSIFCFIGMLLFLILFRQYTSPLFFITVILFLMIYVFKKNLLPLSYHDNEAMEHFKNIQKLFPYYLNLSSNKLFASIVFKRMLMIPVFLLLSFAFFIKLKKAKTAILFSGLIMGYILFVNVCFYDIQQDNKMYLENIYQPLVFFLFVPFVFGFSKKIPQTSLLSLFSFILLFGSIRIIGESNHYTTRLNWERRFIIKNETRKLILHTEYVPMNLLEQSWCAPFEFAILSSIERPYSSSHYISYDLNNIPNYKKRSSNTILSDFEPVPYFDLPQNYFHFPDSISKYLIVAPHN